MFLRSHESTTVTRVTWVAIKAKHLWFIFNVFWETSLTVFYHNLQWVEDIECFFYTFCGTFIRTIICFAQFAVFRVLWFKVATVLFLNISCIEHSFDCFTLRIFMSFFVNFGLNGTIGFIDFGWFCHVYTNGLQCVLVMALKPARS